MEKNKNKNIDVMKEEFGEDFTLYNEKVSTLFKWIPISEQKTKTKHLEKITKNID